MSTNDIHAIRNLLSSDIARMKLADQDAAATSEKLAEAQDDPAASDRLYTELLTHKAIATEFRQSFSARTEMLQHLDLDGITVDDLIDAAVNAPGGGIIGDQDAGPGGEDPDPGAPHRVAGTVHGQTMAQARAVWGEPDWDLDLVVRLGPRAEDRGWSTIRDYILPPEAASAGRTDHADRSINQIDR